MSTAWCQAISRSSSSAAWWDASPTCGASPNASSRRSRGAEALAEAVRIVSARSLDEVAVEGILEATGQVVPSGYRAVLLAEDEDQVLVVGADVGGPESRRGRRLP